MVYVFLGAGKVVYLLRSIVIEGIVCGKVSIFVEVMLVVVVVVVSVDWYYYIMEVIVIIVIVLGVI